METILILVYLAYLVWAVYSGYQVLSGRLEWLDRRAPLNMVVKAVLSVVVGYVIAVFYLIYVILRFFGMISRL